MVWCIVAWCGVVYCSVVWRGVVYCSVMWCGVVYCSVEWSGVCVVMQCGVVHRMPYNPSDILSSVLIDIHTRLYFHLILQILRLQPLLYLHITAL